VPSAIAKQQSITKQPRTSRWVGAESRSRIVRYEHLMEASEQRLGDAARSGIPAEELVAARILDNPKDFGRWESHHAGLMRRIDAAGSADAQKYELLAASVRLIHHKALFEYLQTSQIRDRARVHLFGHLFSHADYRTSVISEHRNYMRSAASYLCSNHVGTHLMLDGIFDRPLCEYERLYAEYFRVYCTFMMTPASDPTAACVRPLLASLKRQACNCRSALLACV